MQIDELLLIIIINVRRMRMFGCKLIDITAQFRATATVVQLPFAVGSVQLFDLRHKGRNADTASDEQMLTGPEIERKQINRIAESHGITQLHFLVQKQRATPPVIITAHRNRIGVTLCRV